MSKTLVHYDPSVFQPSSRKDMPIFCSLLKDKKTCLPFHIIQIFPLLTEAKKKKLEGKNKTMETIRVRERESLQIKRKKKKLCISIMLLVCLKNLTMAFFQSPRSNFSFSSERPSLPFETELMFTNQFI